jgi:uracil-DNA glycosylase family 4
VERGYSSGLAAELASGLDWWVEAGVDALVQESPRDWLKPVVPDVASPPAADAAPKAQPVSRPAAEPLPGQLDLFQEWLRTSPTLPYAAPGAPRVCPSGNPAAGLMVLTGMPSTDDCAAGALMLAAIGRDRGSAYLAGLSCLRPIAGRLDAAGAAQCADIARHHVALVAPKAVLLLGEACSRALLGLGAAEARGRVHRIETAGGPVSAVVTLPPDYLLAQPSAKALAWADLQLLMKVLS